MNSRNSLQTRDAFLLNIMEISFLLEPPAHSLGIFLTFPALGKCINLEETCTGLPVTSAAGKQGAMKSDRGRQKTLVLKYGLKICIYF